MTFDPRASAQEAFAKGKKPKGNGAAAQPETMTVAELLSLEFPPVKWIVPAVVCEGLTLFAGRPKLGKSWAALDWALAVAGDRPALGAITCETGNALVLALEDSRRRLQGRLKKLGAKPNPRMDVCTVWPRIDQGGIEAIRTWLQKHPDARLAGR